MATTENSHSGKLILPITLPNDSVSSMAVLADGKILLAGNFSIIRINTDGSLDTNFSDNGRIVIQANDTYYSGSSMWLQENGSILLSGSKYSDNNYAFSTINLSNNGLLDISNNNTGELITTTGLYREQAYNAIRQSDGKLLIDGYISPEDSYIGGAKHSLIRLNANGSLDSSFGVDGKYISPIKTSANRPTSIAVQSDGKILLADYLHTDAYSGSYDLNLVCLNSDGSLDISFGEAGSIAAQYTGFLALTLALQEDGKILLGGYYKNREYADFGIIRLNADGSLDTQFGNNGKVYIAVGLYDDIAQTMAVQEDGKILLGGYSHNGKDNDYSLIRLNAEGSLDTSFSDDGKIIIPVGASQDSINTLALQEDGKILIAGSSSSSTNITNGYALEMTGYTSPSVVRLNSDGSLDTSFGQPADTLVSNIFTSNRLFVTQLYHDTLYRSPEREGLNFWQDHLDAGHISRADVVSAFLDSSEFQDVTGGIIRLHLAFSGGITSPGQLAGLHDMMTYGLSSLKRWTAGVAQTNYNQLPDDNFINKAYQDVLGHDASQYEYTFLTQQLATGTSRGDLLFQLVDSAEYRAKTDADVTLALMYIGLLYRPPEQEGYSFWQAALQGGMDERVVINEFLASPEYQARFMPEGQILITGQSTEIEALS